MHHKYQHRLPETVPPVDNIQGKQCSEKRSRRLKGRVKSETAPAPNA
jgi:hypothetical protein